MQCPSLDMQLLSGMAVCCVLTSAVPPAAGSALTHCQRPHALQQAIRHGVAANAKLACTAPQRHSAALLLETRCLADNDLTGRHMSPWGRQGQSRTVILILDRYASAYLLVGHQVGSPDLSGHLLPQMGHQGMGQPQAGPATLLVPL